MSYTANNTHESIFTVSPRLLLKTNVSDLNSRVFSIVGLQATKINSGLRFNKDLSEQEREFISQVLYNPTTLKMEGSIPAYFRNHIFSVSTDLFSYFEFDSFKKVMIKSNFPRVSLKGNNLLFDEALTQEQRAVLTQIIDRLEVKRKEQEAAAKARHEAEIKRTFYISVDLFSYFDFDSVQSILAANNIPTATVKGNNLLFDVDLTQAQREFLTNFIGQKEKELKEQNDKIKKEINNKKKKERKERKAAAKARHEAAKKARLEKQAKKNEKSKGKRDTTNASLGGS